MNNRININTIVVFEPDDYLSVTIKDIISDKYNTLYVHDEVSFNNTVNRVDDIDLIIVLDEKDRYDALDILNKYLDERWFIETMTLVLSKERDNIRMNKAYSTGVQDYLFIDDIIETDYKRTLELCIEHQIRLKNKIRHLRLFTNYDGLTGLYNQSVGEDMIIKMMNNHPDSDYLFMIIDIDYFKHANDVMGHDFGNRVIIEEARRLKELSIDGLAIRYGGDEFILFIPVEGNIENKLKDIYEYLDFIIEDYRITNSIGAMYVSKGNRDYEDMFNNADQALYVAKANGRNQYKLYSENMKYKLDGVEEDVRNEVLNINSSALIHSLVNGYSYVYQLDLNKLGITKLTKVASGDYGWSDPIECIPFINKLLEIVDDKHQLQFSEFVNPNTLSARLKHENRLTYDFIGKDSKEYTLEYLAGDNDEGKVINALMIIRESDSNNINNINDEVTAIEKCLSSSITHVYNAIWIIHNDTLYRELVSIQTDISRHRRINRLFEGGDYWEDTKGYINLFVREDEREALLEAIKPEVLFKEVDENVIYKQYFHRKIDGVSYYCEYSFVNAVYNDENVVLQLYRRIKEDN